ncbi:hypothetical protein N865_12135 [Intrasporangium oryzae NRRL B-24470]|uniref:Uncharacterized protein n=1 Tax=Intrasporangium oryzae NRRL B-24470 TaxID=1386089 RepID=W9GAS5_9MICO|nr:hypothetical protein [Intrasporangium oryzae]EWT00969.1 hypothetical protein N865_12135 [Intrasporangium oryzae NRRL B-24470]
MSRTPIAPLFDRLVDDAAVFPPGLAPLDVAVREHLARRTGPYAAQLGPLLVPATAAAEVSRLAAGHDQTTADPLGIGLIARPGSPTEPVVEAVGLLRNDERVVVHAVEVGWSDRWRELLALEVPMVVEVGLGAEQEAALDDIAVAVDDEADVTAKFRTGPTETWAWPDESALGRFLDAVVLRGLSFKLTGGLHHAVRGTYEGQPMHGLLNVLLAVHEALDGAEAPELAQVLRQTDEPFVVDHVIRLGTDDVARVRASFTGYGCCGVDEPLGELAALGLVT